jgi:signal peptidase II
VASDGADAPARRPAVRRAWIIAGAAAVVLLLDQLSKHWAVTRLTPGTEGVHVVGDLWFRLAFNSGMSFSLGTGNGPVVAVIAIVIIGVLIWLARSIRSRPQLVLVGIVMGGAAGNLCDRIFRAGEGFLGGRVVDFVYVGWWPTFNVADSAIVVGGIVLAVLLTFWPDESPPTTGDLGAPDEGSADVAAPGPEDVGTPPR